MGAVGRYRKLYPRLWRHEGFRRLTPTSQRITLYLLTGPQTNRIGVFMFSGGTACEDLNVSAETFAKGLADVGETFGWLFDAGARVFYIPSWWRFNPPENANVLLGNLKDLSEIPSSKLVDAFAANLETLPETLWGTFREGCSERLPRRSPTQDQEQGSETGNRNRTQEQRSAHAARDERADLPEELRRAAKQATLDVQKPQDADTVLDQIRALLPKGSQKYSRADLERAVAAARNGSWPGRNKAVPSENKIVAK